MFGLVNRGELDGSTEHEFEQLGGRLKQFLLVEHNEDGTHNFDLSSYATIEYVDAAIAGVAPLVHVHDAGDITTGALAKARQHAQTAYKDEANTFNLRNVFTLGLDGGGSAQTNSLIRARGLTGSVEFGHTNASGGANVIGGESTSGKGFIAFHAEVGTNADTYKTRGIKGSVLRSDVLGGFSFDSVTTASADNQTASNVATLDTSGNFTAIAAIKGLNFRSVTGSASAATGTPTTVITLPATDAVYIVNYYIAATADPANYTGCAVLKVNAGVAVLTVISAGALHVPTFSGLNLQLTQSSGITLTVNAIALRIS